MIPRNLVIVSTVLTCGIGGLTLKLGSFNLAGVGLVSLLAVIINLVLPDQSESQSTTPLKET